MEQSGSITLESIEKKIGAIEEGKTLRLNSLSKVEIQFLIDSHNVSKNQKKRLLKKLKVN